VIPSTFTVVKCWRWPRLRWVFLRRFFLNAMTFSPWPWPRISHWTDAPLTSGAPIWGESKTWREQSPALQAGNHAKGTGFTTPILITVGELDYRVPMNNALMWFALNQRLGVTSRLLVFPEENHWILKRRNSIHWYGEVLGWIARHLS